MNGPGAAARLLAEAIRAERVDVDAQRRAVAAFRSARASADPEELPPTRPDDDWRG